MPLKSLQYDKYMAPEMLALLASRRLGLESEEGIQKQRTTEDFQRQVGSDPNEIGGEVGLQKARGTQAINEAAGARGAYRSGIRLNDIGNFEQDITNLLSQITTAKDRKMTDLANALTMGIQGIEGEQISQGLAGYNQFLSNKLAEEAAAKSAALEQTLLGGTAGYGGAGGTGGAYGADVGTAGAMAAPNMLGGTTPSAMNFKIAENYRPQLLRAPAIGRSLMGGPINMTARRPVSGRF